MPSFNETIEDEFNGDLKLFLLMPKLIKKGPDFEY